MYYGFHITTIIPALNEESAIGKVIDQLRALTVMGQFVIDRILVCDNGSSDDTGKVAADHGAEVVLEPVRGYGAACLKAIASVTETDILLFVNGDGSEVIAEIPLVLAPLIQEDADLVIGSRSLGRSEPGALSPHQLFGNRLAVFLMRVIWRAPVTDLGPFRAIRFDVYLQLNMIDRDYGWTIEMQLKALRQGRRVIEVPVAALRGATPSRVSGTLRGCIGVAYKILGLIFIYGIMDAISSSNGRQRRIENSNQ